MYSGKGEALRRSRCADDGGERGVGSVEEFLWWAELGDGSLAEDDDEVRVEDRFDAVRDDDDGSAFDGVIAAEHLLDARVGRVVNVRGGLVDGDDATPERGGPGEAEQLAFADGEV